MKLSEAFGADKLAPPKKLSPPPHTISLDSDELPDIRNWQPGQRYRIVLDVEQLNMEVGSKLSASFRVISARPQYGGGPVKQAAKGNTDKSATMNALAAKAAKI
jgi:hypothetical protein